MVLRVVRGGSWNDIHGIARAVYRFWDSPTSRNANLGFRLAGSSAISP